MNSKIVSFLFFLFVNSFKPHLTFTFEEGWAPLRADNFSLTVPLLFTHYSSLFSAIRNQFVSILALKNALPAKPANKPIHK